MKVVVSIEQRFDRTPDGTVWSSGVFSRTFWQRYLEVFEGVAVFARVQDVPDVPSEYKRCNGDAVEFHALPHYVGPWQFLRVRPQIVRVARSAVIENNAVILRVPSPIAACIHPALQRMNHPYGVEVVADPYDVFAPGAVIHPLRPLFRWLLPRQLRRHCAYACAAAYVTREALQRRYPCSAYSLGVSDVELPVQSFVTHSSGIELPGCTYARSPRPLKQGKAISLISVGSLDHMFKGPDILLAAMDQLVRRGIDLQLVWVGDGRYRRLVEAKVGKLGLGRRVRFSGQLRAGAPVRAEFDKADLFVLASRQEGLPRAMIEAMARGLPCIGTTVGGIPELLPPEDIVQPAKVDALAEKIHEVVVDPLRMNCMSARNLEAAKSYREDVLRERRVSFYSHVRDRTKAWLHSKGRSNGASSRPGRGAV